MQARQVGQESDGSRDVPPISLTSESMLAAELPDYANETIGCAGLQLA